MLWRWKWQPAPLFLPGKFHRHRSLAGYSPWGRKELDMNLQLNNNSNAKQNLCQCGFIHKTDKSWSMAAILVTFWEGVKLKVFVQPAASLESIFLFLISPNDLSLPKTTVVVSWWLWENRSNMYNRGQNACLLWKIDRMMCPFKNVLYLSRVYCCLFIGRCSFTISRVSSFFHQKWCSGWWPHLVLLIPHTQVSLWVSDTGYRLVLLHDRWSPIY